MGLISFQKAYRQIIPGNNGTIQGVTYPLMMAVINVAHGKVTVRSRYSSATISLSCIHPYSISYVLGLICCCGESITL